MPMLVMTATCASHTLVASHRPSRPTSTTATSTARSANQRNAAAVAASKYDGRTPGEHLEIGDGRDLLGELVVADRSRRRG